MSGPRPRTAIHEDEQGRLLGTVTVIAEALGESVSQVSMWAERRASNGAPRPHPTFHFPTLGDPDPAWYVIDEWVTWRQSYTPDRRPLAYRCEDPNRGTAADVARILGVPAKKVHKLVECRARNGCPSKGQDGFYDLAEFVAFAAPRLAPQGTEEAA